MPQKEIDASLFSPDTVDFLCALARHGVRYLIVGGEAVIFHGHARLTGDIDFFCEPTPSNAAALFAALSDFWQGDIPGVKTADELLERGIILQFGRPPHRLDLMNAIDGVAFNEAWEGRVAASVVRGDQNIPVFYIGLDSLLKNKKASGRPKDQDDVLFFTARNTTLSLGDTVAPPA